MGIYGGNSAIVGVQAHNAGGVPLISSISIPANASQVLIANNTGSAVYIAYSEGDLDTDFSRFEWPTGVVRRLILPPGVGQLFLTPKEPALAATFVSFWLA